MNTRKTILLNLSKVAKTYGRVQAVKKASFSVRTGEVVGFLGPNGAGKTTTIRMIMQETSPSQGKIELFGKSNTQSEVNHRDIGFLGSDMTYEEGLTGRQFLSLVNHIRGGTHQARIDELVQLLGANLTHTIRTLSRGNKQKIGLIAAVMHRPRLLIMDEPTSGFDPLMQRVFVDIIRDHTKAGGGALISSHILSEVQHLASRVLFISEGTILGEQNIHALLRESALRIYVTFSTPQRAKSSGSILAKLPGMAIESVHHDSIRATYQGNSAALLSALADLKPIQCLIQEPELEEVFMQYYNTNNVEKR